MGMVLCLLCACSTVPAYHHYEHVAEEGWDKRDTMVFSVDTIVRPGRYVTTLCVRTDATYPYRNLSVRVVRQSGPSGGAVTRRVDFDITRENGTRNGNGITYYTYEKTIDTLELRPGDSLAVKVAHNMRGETVTGVTDVGVKVALEE